MLEESYRRIFPVVRDTNEDLFGCSPTCHELQSIGELPKFLHNAYSLYGTHAPNSRHTQRNQLLRCTRLWYRPCSIITSCIRRHTSTHFCPQPSTFPRIGHDIHLSPTVIYSSACLKLEPVSIFSKAHSLHSLIWVHAHLHFWYCVAVPGSVFPCYVCTSAPSTDHFCLSVYIWAPL